MVLADAGARVIKVEPPEGDRLRRRNPSGFLVWNRGKESQVADLRTPEGQARFKDLAATADVVIEGFAPGRTAAWGVDAATLARAESGARALLDHRLRPRPGPTPTSGPRTR